MKNISEYLCYKTIIEYEDAIKKEIKYVQSEIRDLPVGKITIVENGKYYQFYVRTANEKTIRELKGKRCKVKKEWEDKNGKHHIIAYLPKSEQEYAMNLLKREKLEKELQALQTLGDWLSKYSNLICRAAKTENTFYEDKTKLELLDKDEAQKRARLTEWANAEYEHNEDHPENLKYLTKGGLNVRSKSEMMIANELIDQRIPFRYEPRMWPNGKRHHPDFLIIHPVTGKVYIWEHNGMMDVPRYINKAAACLEDYSMEGFLLDDDLIFTSESDSFPLTTDQVESKVRSILFDDGRHRNNDAKCLIHCLP